MAAILIAIWPSRSNRRRDVQRRGRLVAAPAAKLGVGGRVGPLGVAGPLTRVSSSIGRRFGAVTQETPTARHCLLPRAGRARRRRSRLLAMCPWRSLALPTSMTPRSSSPARAGARGSLPRCSEAAPRASCATRSDPCCLSRRQAECSARQVRDEVDGRHDPVGRWLPGRTTASRVALASSIALIASVTLADGTTQMHDSLIA